MAITYPLTLPTTPTFSSITYRQRTVVGATRSPYTGQRQTFVWPGQWWELSCVLPPIKSDADADSWVCWKLALNGQQGTFNLGPSTRKVTRGTAVAIKEVGSGAAANSTTLPVQSGAGGSGDFVVGDWLQVGVNLHRVIQKNSSVSYDVWPRLRSAYAQGTAIVFTNPKGLFCLPANDTEWTVDVAKMTGLVLNATEAI